MTDVVTGGASEILAAVRSVAEEQIAPSAAETDRERRFPAADLRSLAGTGALGLMLAPEHGGAGAGLGELVEACEIVGAASASTGMVFLMHSVAGAAVAGGAGPKPLLERLASGTALGTLAFSERGTGAHFYNPEMRVERDDAKLRVSGRKSFVTSAGHADVMLVLVQSDGGEGLDCYAIERTTPGVRVEGSWQGLGMTANSSVALVLEDVVVADDAPPVRSPTIGLGRAGSPTAAVEARTTTSRRT